MAAFEGWNDAGDAASTAVRFLGDRWRAEAFAHIEAEPFFDFTTNRPRIELTDDERRRIVWPQNELAAASVPGLDRDVVVLYGTEPALAWRTYCDEVLGLAERLEASLVLTCGALISDVPHSRPVQIYGLGHGTDVLDDLGIEQSSYEGPTGIVGVLHSECQDREMPSASLWAAVPSYVHGAPSPKAALALVTKLAEALRVHVPTTDLEIATAAYERQVNQLVENDEDTASLVRELEQRYDELGESGSLVEEVEQFLRGQSDE